MENFDDCDERTDSAGRTAPIEICERTAYAALKAPQKGALGSGRKGQGVLGKYTTVSFGETKEHTLRAIR